MIAPGHAEVVDALQHDHIRRARQGQNIAVESRQSARYFALSTDTTTVAGKDGTACDADITPRVASANGSPKPASLPVLAVVALGVVVYVLVLAASGVVSLQGGRPAFRV